MGLGWGTGSLTKRQNEEEGEPAEDENTHDDGKSLGRFFLTGELEEPHGEGAPEVVPLAPGAGERLLQHAAAVDAQYHFHGFIPLLLDACLQAPGGPPGHHVDPEVHHQDDHEGQVEGEEGGEQGIARLLRDATDALIRWWRLLPSQQRPDGDDHGREPDHHEDDPRLPLGHDCGVLEGVLDADVPVHGDNTQAHDGGGAAQHIHCCPDVAEDAPKHPEAQHLQGGREGQHGGAEQQVGDGQVDDEVVGDCLQVPVASHREDDEDVPHDG